MNFKNIIKIIKPTDENQSQFYSINRIIYILGKERTYRLTHVDIGLAALLKREYKAEYFKKDMVALINPVYFGTEVNKEPIEIDCLEDNLQKMLISLLKGNK